MNLLSILEDIGLLVDDQSTDDLSFDFVKSGCYYTTNALQHNGSDEYIVTIERDGSKWVVYAEEHEPRDLITCGYTAVHNTLKAAMESAIEFARDFQYCLWCNQRDMDDDN